MVVTAVGATLVLAGVVMLVTPGPGIVAILAGLAVLASEYGWAARLRDRMVARIKDARTVVRARLVAERAKRAGSHAPTPLPLHGTPDTAPAALEDDAEATA